MKFSELKTNIFKLQTTHLGTNATNYTEEFTGGDMNVQIAARTGQRIESMALTAFLYNGTKSYRVDSCVAEFAFLNPGGLGVDFGIVSVENIPASLGVVKSQKRVFLDDQKQLYVVVDDCLTLQFKSLMATFADTVDTADFHLVANITLNYRDKIDD